MRGLFRRCPFCGSRGIFLSWFHLAPKCPACDFNFDREPGWYIGGMVINTAASMAVFAAILAIGMVAFWPNVPWLGIQIASAIGITLSSVFFYPMSKTVWLGIDLLMTGMDPSVRK